MVLKDWKKTFESTEQISFDNKKNNLSIRIFRRISKDDRKVRYDLEVFKEYKYGSRNPISKTFRKKTQALKYAKAYMRKH